MSTLVLLGEPGSGKSASLARLGQRAREHGASVLAIKADAIDPAVKTLADLTGDLKLPLDVLECIRRVAATREVVVLIDQLDALASIVDLRSERLNVLLDLILELSDEKNVRVVCSCRSFEYRHDVRFLSIQATSVTLALPTWSQVSEIFRSSGIDADPWPEAFRELLRTPQHLKIFLERLRDSSEYRFFNSYQQMLDDLWARRVSNPDGPPRRAALLMEMAEEMASTESLWVPLARFEGQEEVILDLEAKGLVTRHEGGLRVGFRHQTLFEHARARAFARGHGSIAAYTLDRQDSLFVRPTLWNTLPTSARRRRIATLTRWRSSGPGRRGGISGSCSSTSSAKCRIPPSASGLDEWGAGRAGLSAEGTRGLPCEHGVVPGARHGPAPRRDVDQGRGSLARGPDPGRVPPLRPFREPRVDQAILAA